MTVVPGPDVEFAALAGRRSGDPLRAIAADSSIRIVRLARSPRRFAHRHPESEEIVFVRSGRGLVSIDGNRSQIEAGDVVYIPAGALHATIPDPGIEMELICFFPHPRLADNYEDTDVNVMAAMSDDPNRSDPP